MCVNKSEERHYWRCVGCCLPVVLPGGIDPQGVNGRPGAECGICGWREWSYMGKVWGASVHESSRLECVCNELCVTAAGPECSCRCEGANHGVGLAGYFEVPAGRSWPVVQLERPRNPVTVARARERAAAWRGQRERLLALGNAWRVQYLERRSAGWVPGSIYRADKWISARLIAVLTASQAGQRATAAAKLERGIEGELRSAGWSVPELVERPDLQAGQGVLFHD